MPEYVPAGHAVQTELSEAPTVPEYVPVGHGVQTVLSETANVPATHAEQAVAPGGEMVPALQLSHEEPMTLPAATFETAPVGLNTLADSPPEQVSPRHQVASLLVTITDSELSCRVQNRLKAIPAGPPEFPATKRMVLYAALSVDVICAGVIQVLPPGTLPAWAPLTKTVQ